MDDHQSTPSEVGITEAAEWLGVSRSTVHRAIREGRLPAKWVTYPSKAAWKVKHPTGTPARGQWRIRIDDLAAYEPATPQERGRRGGKAKGKRNEGAPGPREAS